MPVKLKRCNLCGGDIVNEKVKCPHCGDPNPCNHETFCIGSDWVSINDAVLICEFCVNHEDCKSINQSIRSTKKGKFKFRCPIQGKIRSFLDETVDELLR